MSKIRLNQHTTLCESEPLTIGEGTAPKLFYKHGVDQYIIKKPKQRTLSGIFSTSLPSCLHHYKAWTFARFKTEEATIPAEDHRLLKPYFTHLQDLMIEAALGEIIYMHVIKVLFPVSMEVPETYLHIDKKSKEPWIISKKINSFNEFLRERLVQETGRILKSSSEWLDEKKPCRADLKLNDNELMLLGKLYCSALITHDWDLFNNIMLANSGCIGDSKTASKVCVVDGGNKFHFGFDGLTCEESTFRNPDFNLPDAAESYRFTTLFDKAVCPDLPRLIISDLYELTNCFFLHGMEEMLAEANQAIANHPDCLREAINLAFSQTTLNSEESCLQRINNKNSTLFNQHYYRASKGYALEKILLGRIKSCTMFMNSIDKEDVSQNLKQRIQFKT